MKIIRPQEILKQIEHRSCPLPHESWVLYSEWKDVLMLHWKVDANVIKHILPQNLCIDTFEGGAWVSMSIASVENFKNKLFSILKHGFGFEQILMQTYIVSKGKPGIFIFNHELEKSFSKNIYQRLLKLKPGETDFKKDCEGLNHKLFANNEHNGFKLGMQYEFGEKSESNPLENWLVNRFCYFYERENQLFEYDVHHQEYDFCDINLNKFKTLFNFGGLTIDQKPDLIHYSKGIQKLFWSKKIIN
ncbi:MAG TPA: DUF2071 domain-containing protein [Edaphocola sp.]|nr:DUF2071 domain-containing protein [Edaphocola sp.]